MGGDRAKFVISVVPRSTRGSKEHPWLCLGCLLAALRREGCHDVDGTIPQTVGLHTVQVDKGESQGTMPGALPLHLDLHHHGLKPL